MNEPKLPTILIMSEANRSALKVMFASGENDERIAYECWIPESDIREAREWMEWLENRN